MVLNQIRSISLRKIHFDKYAVVAICWISSLLIGSLVAAVFAVDSVSVRKLLVNSKTSILWLTISVLLPFLLSALSVCLGRGTALPWILFANGFVFAYVSHCVFTMAGNAGWLLQPMLLFTQYCMAPFFCWFVIRHYEGNAGAIHRDLWVCAIAAILFSAADCYFISPFLERLLII